MATIFQDNVNQTKFKKKKKNLLNNIFAQAFDFYLIFKTVLFL